MGRKILERQNVASRERNDLLWIGPADEFCKGLQYGDEIFGGPIICDHDDERTPQVLLKQH